MVTNASNRGADIGLLRPNVLYYWAILKHAKLLLIGVTMTFALSGLGIAWIMQPVYEATVTMVHAPRLDGRPNARTGLSQIADSISGGGLLNAFLLNDPGQINTGALATLKSRSFLTSFIEERKLLPKLFKPAAFERDDPEDVPTLYDAYERFSKKVFSVETKPVESVIQLTIQWKDPSVAADWANGLVSKLNANIRKATIADASKRLDYLNQQLDTTSIIPIRQSIYRLIEAQIHIIMLAETQVDYAFKVIDPAAPADPDRFVRPRRSLIVLAVTVFGFAIAGFAAIWRDYLRRLREQEILDKPTGG